MNSAQRESLRLSILAALDLAKPYAVNIQTLRASLPTFRMVDEDALRAEVGYLIDKGFAVEKGKAISPENKQWAITAEGRDLLATEGLA